MDFVYCDHITSYKEDDPYILSPDDQRFPSRFALGRGRALVLCSKCEKALAYELVTQFIKDSQYKPLTSFRIR